MRTIRFPDTSDLTHDVTVQPDPARVSFRLKRTHIDGGVNLTTETLPAVRLKKVVVLGANGAMGAGSAAMFASGGCEVTLVARDLAKSESALGQILGIAK